MTLEWPQLFLIRSHMRFWLYEYNIHDIYFSGMPYVYFNQALYVYEDYNPIFELTLPSSVSGIHRR
ncbi:hypothetical protein LINPERHAP1_LOCUS20289, partial [Linum perenne]